MGCPTCNGTGWEGAAPARTICDECEGTGGRSNDGPRYPQPHDQKPINMQTLTQWRP